jgi:hypothetical protein
MVMMSGGGGALPLFQRSHTSLFLFLAGFSGGEN